MKTAAFVGVQSALLVLSNVIGISHFAYEFNRELLLEKSDSSVLKLIELSRTIVLFSFTYAVAKRPTFRRRYAQLVRFWAVIVLARLSRKRTITYDVRTLLINGIVEFDRKLTALSTRVDDGSPGTLFWSAVFAAYSVFYVTLHAAVSLDAWTIDRNTVGHLIEILFTAPRVMDFAIVAAACFYLCNLGHRFGALASIWRSSLPSADANDPRRGQTTRMTTAETAKLAETVRLLHAELSGVLGTFNAAYGPMFLISFAFFAFDAACDTYRATFSGDFAAGLAPCLQYVHDSCLVFCVACVASWTDNKKNEFITILRSTRIIDLRNKSIIQIKLFMEQLNVYEQTEFSACGIINFKLNLITSVMMLMVTISATLVHLRKQPFFVKLFNTTYV